ncbi:MAG TPA: T9SS type A sorting domain-containing protein, partial [Candidatus Kapabacteria bacterium]|nr:T9SS type A sorting domain-containing protein [Candidatus Kapabacteria bacterium]
PPYTIPAGGQQVVNVAATAINNQPGSYQAFVSIAEPCNSATSTLNSIFGFNGDLAVGTNHPPTYIGGCRSDIKNATFKNLSSNDSITVVSLLITNANGANDAEDFQLASSFNSTEVNPNGGSLDVPILFQPLAAGADSAALIFTLQGKGFDGGDSTWFDTVILKGVGVSVQRTIGVGSITAPPQYHTTDLGTEQIPIVADAPIDANAPNNGTVEAYGYQFDVSWKRDVFNYTSITAPTGITFGPPTVTYNAATDMETRTFRGTSLTPLSGETTLGTINVTAYLNKGDTTPIVPSNVEWFGQNETTLCYVSTATTAAAFNFDEQCGNTEVQKFMQNSVVVTSIGEIQPNPVRNNALVSYTVRSQAPITIGIYDLLGNEVRRIVDGEVQLPGTHSIAIQSEGLGSGSYYCRLTDGQQVSTKPFELEK